MKHFAWVVVGIFCSAPLGAQDVTVFTPSQRGDAPIFMNGQVVRIDRAAGTITIRNNDGRRVLTVDRQALGALGNVRVGSSVILGMRETGSGASARPIVTDIRPSGAVSLGASRVSANASLLASGGRSIGTAQVVSTDRSLRRMTVVDSTGATRVLDVRGGALTTLGSLRPGDSVSLGVAAPLVSGTPAGTVTSIDSPGQSVNATTARGTAPASGRSASGGLSTSAPSSTGGTVTVFNNDSLPQAPRLPSSPDNGLNRNPATTGVQPAPGAQPIPGVQGPTGMQPVPGAQPLPGSTDGVRTQAVPGAQPIPGSTGGLTPQGVPGAQPLPGTGVTGQSAANPGLAPQPVPAIPGQPNVDPATGVVTTTNPGLSPQAVPGSGGQNAINSGATGGVSTAPNTGGVATTGQPTTGSTGIPGNVTVPGVSGLTGGMSSRGVGSGNTGGAGGVGTTGSRGGGGATSGGTATGGGSPILSPSIPQLGGGGFVGGGLNSQIPSIPPSAGTMNSPVLPVPAVLPNTYAPQTPNEVAAVRELASRDFDMAVAVVAARASEVDRAWVAYRSQCVTSTVPLNNRAREWFAVLDGSLIGPTEDVCESSYNEVARLAQGVQASLDMARDTARRADVLPGRMRDVLQRYNLDL